MRLIQATKREIDMSNRKRTPGDSGADAAVSPSGKSDKSDVKIIPADRLERARAKKYGCPYDPARDAWTKSYVKWKRENARPEPRGSAVAYFAESGSEEEGTSPETPAADWRCIQSTVTFALMACTIFSRTRNRRPPGDRGPASRVPASSRPTRPRVRSA